jgi:hypothetical protein
MQNVVDTQKAAAVRDYQMAMPKLSAQAARAGAFGGARDSIQRAEAARNLTSQLQNIQATGTQKAFEDAQRQQQFGANLGLQGLQAGYSGLGLGIQGQQAGMQGIQGALAGTAQGMQGAQTGLQGVGAAQAGYGLANQAASNVANIGTQQQQADLARLGLTNQLGQQQQAYQQQLYNQAIQDYATQQQYPLMQLGFMSNMLRGLPMQAMTTQSYQAPPSAISQLAGLGTAGVGAYGLGKATGVFKEGGQVKGYKYGGAISSDKLETMADSLSVEQLQAQLRDPSLTTEERQIFADALSEKSRTRTPQYMGLASAPAGNMDNLGMAGGGIIAFAEGDLVDEEDDDSIGVGYSGQADDDELIDAYLARGVPAGAYGFSGRGLGSVSTGGNAGVGINPEAPSGSGIRADAKAPRGIESLTQYVLAKESGGRRYDKSGNLLTSPKGAEGEMQVMPMTQRDPGFGVKPARDDSPEEKARVGRDYLAALYNKYGDEKLAAIAYNMGPGATDKWLKAGADVSKLPKETRGYIAQLAKGGVVAFQPGGYVDPLMQFSGLDEEGYAMDELRRQKEIQDRYNKFGYLPPKDPAAVKAVAEMGPPKSAMRDEAAEKAELDARAAYEAQLAQGQKDKELATAGTSKLEDILARREQNLEKQGAIDANLALMMAGLGIAGGTSKNALENVAKGAQLGVGTYMTGAKQRTADENAILSGRLGLERMRGLQDIRQQQMAQNLEGKIGSQIGAREKQLEQAAFNNITKTGLMMDSAEGQAAIAREVQRLKSQDQYLAKLYRQYGLPPIEMMGAPATMSKEDLIKRYGKTS